MRRLITATAAAALLLPAVPAAASPRVPVPTVQLPGDASASAVRADASTWLVGARPSRTTTELARAAGARSTGTSGWEVSRGKARSLAGALRRHGLLTYAEPNRLSRLHASRAIPQDPLDAADPWRDRAVDPSLMPPAVTSDSPALALVDAKADTSHPEFASGGHLTSLSGQSVEITHGTATAGVASAPANGIGMMGVWPGMRAINVPLPADGITCADSARGIVRAIGTGAKVINMSYGSSSFCNTEYEALQLATSKGVTLVAAAGNEFDEGNPLEFPASLPHVLTVGALNPNDTPAFFSNENAALDLSAIGVGIVSTIPVALDNDDGNKDGYEDDLAGTSFSAPMVAAAAAWVRQARPDLTVDQLGQVMRLSARDVGPKGYDSSTGFGALDVANALVKRPPIADPDEPNDDIRFVNGKAFGGKPDTPIWRGKGRTTLKALLDYYEDPYDVYRLRVPAHSRVHVTTVPTFGNPDLELYSSAATRVATSRHRLARSRHTGQRADTVAWSNHSGRTRTVYVNVTVPRQTTLDAGYTLTVS